MTDREQEMMERYIYQVTRRLPGDQRKETALELQELIGDMMEEKEMSVEEVLTKLGDPALLAERYQDITHCLIGPEYYDIYLWFVKVVLLCSAIPVLIAEIADIIRGEGAAYEFAGQANTVVSVIYGIVSVVPEVLTAGLTAFGAVTLVFVIMERQKVKLEKKQERAWQVSDLGEPAKRKRTGWTPGELTPVPDPKARISRGDCIVEIVFTVIFCVLLIFAPHFFSAVCREGEKVVFIPIFNLEQWKVVLPLFVLCLFVGLADNVVRLAVGIYGKAVLISSLICNGISLVLAVILLKVLPFWNPDFGKELAGYAGRKEEALRFLTRWDGSTASDILLAVILFAILLDVGTVVYKTLRYGKL